VALVNCYITRQQLQDVLRDQLTAHDEEYDRAITAASRQIDSYCGRHFFQTATATAKKFRPTDCDEVWTGDIATTTGLIVKTDDDDDGTFETTWTIDTDFQMEPFDRKNGTWPYELIVALGDAEFPTPNNSRYTGSSRTRRPSRRARVQITATWGWPAVPGEVASACQILAVDHFKSKDLTNIASQYGTGTRFTRDLTGSQFGRGVRFTRLREPIFNPEAESLLQPLRHIAVA
jgi:hypothetical protein